MNSVNCVFFCTKKVKKATTARLEDIFFELCVLHSNLKLKGLCAVVCVLLLLECS